MQMPLIVHGSPQQQKFLLVTAGVAMIERTYGHLSPSATKVSFGHCRGGLV